MIPVEAVLAAGCSPMDLNNTFISSSDPDALVEQAELDGLPRNLCSWVKGIYSVVKNRHIRRLVVPFPGDCSNCHTLGELLADQGFEVFEFRYPALNRVAGLKKEISRLECWLGGSGTGAGTIFEQLAGLRLELKKLDRLAWKTRSVHSRDYFAFMIGASDFNSDPAAYELSLKNYLASAPTAPSQSTVLPIALTGVPPVITDLPETLEKIGARIVFSEVPRQFTLPRGKSLASAYSLYTYPYDIASRIKDIRSETKQRGIAGIIHYVQSFCHRQMESLLLKPALDIPVLILEGDRPGKINSQQLMRLESFVTLLLEKKQRENH